jgi:hypothetical protein
MTVGPGGADAIPPTGISSPAEGLTGRGLREGFLGTCRKALVFGSERLSFLEGARGQETLAQQY